ncbi:MAG: sigma-70 family RNA polymerase sigma factor [Verrucomicrobiota bacterium]
MIPADEIAKTLLRHRLDLTAYLRVIVRDAALAEDVFQETVVKALQSGEEFEADSNLLAWFRRTGRNRAIDHIRKQGREAKILDRQALDILEAQAADMDSPGTTEQIRALESCLEKLTPRAREVLRLRYHEKMTGEDVAKRCNTTLNAIYRMMGRSYGQLRGCMERKLATEGSRR